MTGGLGFGAVVLDTVWKTLGCLGILRPLGASGICLPLPGSMPVILTLLLSMTATESAPVFFATKVKLLEIEKGKKQGFTKRIEAYPVGSRPTALRHPRQLQLPKQRGHLARPSGEKMASFNNQSDILEYVTLRFVMASRLFRENVDSTGFDLV